MQHPGLLVADAGQAYEAMRYADIIETLDKLFNAIRDSRSDVTVWARYGRKSECGFGGKLSAKYRDRVIILPATLERFVHAYLGLKWFHGGPLMLRQMDGVPIGGPLSGSLLGGRLSDNENAKDRQWFLRGEHLRG